MSTVDTAVRVQLRFKMIATSVVKSFARPAIKVTAHNKACAEHPTSLFFFGVFARVYPAISFRSLPTRSRRTT